MTCMGRGNKELQPRAKQVEKEAKSLMEILRAKIQRGNTGIKGLSRTFKIMDDDDSKSLDINEFCIGVRDYGIVVEKEQIQAVFAEIDVDRTGMLNFDEFITALGPPLSVNRKKLVMDAFRKLDKTGDGVITTDDLKGVYNVKNHPKCQNDEWTEDRCLRQFLDTFDSNDKDGKITKEEFANYNAGVSASIGSDAYFSHLMTSTWKL